MNSRFCWILVMVSLVMLVMAIPVTAARGEGGGGASPAGASGIAASDTSVTAGGGGHGDAPVSTGVFSPGAGEGAQGGDSIQESSAPDSGNQQQSMPGSTGPVSMTDAGYSGEDNGPSPAGQGQGSGSPAGGQEAPGDGIIGQGRGPGPEPMGSSLAATPVKAGQGEPVGPAGGQSTRGAGSGYSSGQGLQGPGPESQPEKYGGQRPVLLAAATLGSAGAAWQGSGQEGSSFPADPGHAPGPRNRQQGPPAQSGQYPCGPAERGVPHPASSPQKERDENGQPDKRPRSRREETIDTEGESGVPLSSPPETTRLPLFSSIFFLFGGYRRISRKNILDHDLRRTIYEMICKNPGIDSVTLATVTGINENTLRYHLWKLQEAGKITSLSRPSVVRYFQNQGAFDPREQVIWHYLWSDTPRHILALLYRTPGLSRQNLADWIGISGPSVTRQMMQLTDDNLVENRSFGRTNTYYLTDQALAALSRAFSFRPPVSREAAAAHNTFSNQPGGQEEGQALIET